MVAFDANEILTPFCEGHREGAILFDCQRMRQVEYGLFVPAWWGSEPIRYLREDVVVLGSWRRRLGMRYCVSTDVAE